MTAKQTKRLAMYLAVKAELQAISNAVANAGLSALIDVYTAKVEEVFDLHEVQSQVTPPRTALRDDSLDAMIAAALVVAGPLRAHAHQQGLHEAEAVADVTQKEFERLRIIHRVTLAQRIHDAAQPLMVALTPLGVSEPILVELQAKIDAAKAILNQPRTTIVGRHKATRDLGALFEGIDAMLSRQLDGAMAPLIATHPDLHDRYSQARKLARQPRPETEEEATPQPAAGPVTAAVTTPPPRVQQAA